MRALAIVHQEDTGPGVFVGVMAARGVELETWRPAIEPAPDLERYGAVISLGGAMNADEDARHPWLRTEKDVLAALLASRMPVLGVCLGAQLLAAAGGASVRRAGEPEIGWYEVALTEEAGGDPVLGAMPARFKAFEWHSYEAGLPAGAVELARSAACSQAFRAGERAWGIQFHAEVTAAIVDGWIVGYRADPDAVAMGLDADALRAETRERIGAWNELGRDLCGRFLDAAATAA